MILGANHQYATGSFDSGPPASAIETVDYSRKRASITL